ncbi:Vacuolar protein-sorting-associated protein 27 [Geranomyces variabilis]|nr:Vacuolar protein-sorting-associated protein 27 [Geranomyces variabilis]
MSFLFSNPLDELVDRATSENLPVGTDDLVLNLDIADKVKAKEVTPKQAVQSLKRRLNHKNPNVQILALKLTDTCVKNSGHHFLQEVASREFVDNLVSLARAPIGTNQEVRQKILGFIQSWGLAFKSKADLRYLTDVYENLKREGANFPPVERSETSAVMIDTTVAPEWTDSDVCMRCRTTFTTFNRKHHCRNCGQTFCGQCSSKQLPLSHLGIVQDVRVCDTCFTKLSSKSTPSSPPLARRATDSSAARPSGELSRKEEDDLQKALALSLEASRPSGAARPVTPRRTEGKAKYKVDDDDEDLKAAIAASLQDLNISDYSDEKPAATKPAYDYRPPAESTSSRSQSSYPAQSSYPTATASSRDARPASLVSAQPAFNPNELSAVELENIRLFSELVERTEADVIAHGLGALSDSQIQVLYAQIALMQPKLSRSLGETVQKYGEFYELHEQLTSATREYDRLLQERLAAAGYGRKTYGAPASGYQHPQPPYEAAAQYAQPPQHGAQAGGYVAGYAAAAGPPPAGAYYNSGPEQQPVGAQATPPAQQYYDGQYAPQQNQVPQHGAQIYQEAPPAHDPNNQTGGAYQEHPPQGAASNQYAPGPAASYSPPEQAHNVGASEQRAPEAYYQPPPAGAPEHHYAPQAVQSQSPPPQQEGGNYVYQSQAPHQGVGGQAPQGYGYAQPPQHQQYEQYGAPAPVAHVAPPPPEPEAPLIEL